MKTVRLMSAFLMLALLLALVPATLGQDMTFGLSPEDFQALTAANAATAAATSGQFNFTLDLSIAAEGENADVNLTGSGLFADNGGSPVFQLSLAGDATAEGETTPINAELRVVNETLYVQLPEMMGPQWLSLTSADLEGAMASLPMNPADLASGDPAGMAGMSDALTGLAALRPEQYVVMTRDGDHFSTNVDVTGLLSSPEFQSFIVTMAQQDTSAEIDAAEVTQVMSQLPAAMAGTTFSFDQYVTDGMVSRMVLNTNLSIDPSAIGETGDAGSIAIAFDLNLSGFNGTYSVEAPADAMPMSQMMGGM
jgi:hypothetical protein